MDQLPQLGKRSPKLDPRTFKLSDFTVGIEPLNPPTYGGYTEPGILWPVYGNDLIGDCAIAAWLHMIGLWTETAIGKESIFTKDDAIKAYSDVSGYVPGDPSTDNGCFLLDVLNYARKKGINGHKIGAYVSVNWRNWRELHMAINWFGGVYIGLQMPLTAQNQDVCWQVPTTGPVGDASPGLWGGHCVNVVRYTPHSKTVVSWGREFYMSNGFYGSYTDEAYAIVSADWLNGLGLSPTGLDIAGLRSALASL